MVQIKFYTDEGEYVNVDLPTKINGEEVAYRGASEEEIQAILSGGESGEFFRGEPMQYRGYGTHVIVVPASILQRHKTWSRGNKEEWDAYNYVGHKVTKQDPIIIIDKRTNKIIYQNTNLMENKKLKVLVNLLEKETGKRVTLKEFKPSPQEGGDSFYAQLQKLMQQDYETFVKGLNNLVADDKTKEFLRAGLKDGAPGDDRFGVKKGAIKAGALIPTQNEVDITKSLSYPLTKAQSAKDCLEGGPLTLGGNDLVTFNGKYVIDGHHRWSQVFCINPSATMTVVNLSKSGLNPLEALKATQVSIAAVSGQLPVQTVEGTNLLKATEQQIKQYVIQTITDEVCQVFAQMKGFKSKEEIAHYIWGNCQLMQKRNHPIDGAPGRGLMPQTDINLPGVVNALSKGEANSRAPFVKESKEVAAMVKLIEKYTGKRVQLTEANPNQRRELHPWIISALRELQDNISFAIDNPGKADVELIKDSIKEVIKTFKRFKGKETIVAGQNADKLRTAIKSQQDKGNIAGSDDSLGWTNADGSKRKTFRLR